MADDLTFSSVHWLEGVARNSSTNPPTPQAAETDLVHTAVAGTTNGTLVDCTSSYSEAAVEENFKELAVKVNAILAKLRACGIIDT